MRSLSNRELQTLCNVNHDTDVAFLGVTGPRENEEVVGSACYFLNPTTNLAEVAFMVAPEFQGVGLGTALQARLQEYAMSRGVRGFVSEILPGNTSMLRLAASAQGTMTTSRDENAVHVTVLFPDSSSTASTISEFPFQEGSSLNAAGINYKTLKAAAALKRLHELETIALPEAEYTGSKGAVCHRAVD